MSYIPQFKSAGAQSVGGALILNRQTVLLLRNGVEILTPEGEQALAKINAARTIDVQATVVDEPQAAEPVKPRAKKPKAPAEPASTNLDDLLQQE